MGGCSVPLKACSNLDVNLTQGELASELAEFEKRHVFPAEAAKYVRYNYKVMAGSQDTVASLDL